MNYGQFLNMMPEAFLILELLVVFFADFFLTKNEHKTDRLWVVTVGSLVMQTVLLFGTMEPSEAFGGIYVTSQMVNVMKVILTAGTLIVVIMSKTWLMAPHTAPEGASIASKSNVAPSGAERGAYISGEYFMLVLSTLLGMYMMMSSGSFLMFFLGLEMASVPMACMVAFDKNRKNSAEGAAKYILVATFSSGVMLFGISFIYAAAGSLYFDNVAEVLSVKPLTIMGLVFFFSGLGFKISWVPRHPSRAI